MHDILWLFIPPPPIEALRAAKILHCSWSTWLFIDSGNDSHIINGNKIHTCIQGSLSGTERCDSCRLSSYRYSLAVVYDLRSPSLSCTLHPLSHSRPQRVGDLEYALPQTAPLPTARRAVSSLASQATFLFTTLSGLPNLWAPLRKKKRSEIDRR